MSIVRSSNPVFSQTAFRKGASSYAHTGTMSINGTVNKAFLMLLLVLVGAIYTWRIFFNAADQEAISAVVLRWMAIGGIGGFVLALITIFKNSWASVTAPIYAILEGLFLGGISAFFEARYPGMVMQAVALTFATLFLMLFGYRAGIFKVTKKFRTGVIAATGAIALVYFISFILSMFGVNSIVLGGSGLLGIGISLVVVAIAALNLVLDFDFIVKGSERGLPKNMEWIGAFGLIITLVWLYIEFLRLLSRFAGRE